MTSLGQSEVRTVQYLVSTINPFVKVYGFLQHTFGGHKSKLPTKCIITLECDFHVSHRGFARKTTKESVHRHDDARSAEPALGSMSFGDPLLNGMQLAFHTPYTFHSRHSQAVVATGVKHAFTDMWLTWFVNLSNLDTMTVQAPHPPSAQPNFVPHSLTEKPTSNIISYLLINIENLNEELL